MSDPIPDETPYLAEAARAVMAFYGYDRDEIAAAEKHPGHTDECELNGDVWQCDDEDGLPHHATVDELISTTEILRVALEGTLLPVLAERDAAIKAVLEYLTRNAQFSSLTDKTYRRYLSDEERGADSELVRITEKIREILGVSQSGGESL